MAEVVIGVDVGGSLTAAGLVTSDGDVLAEAVAPTHRDGAGSAVALIVGLIAELRAIAERRALRIDGVGLGIPGAVDADAGCVGEEIPHVPELSGLALASIVSDRFGLPAFVDNDCNAHVLAEWMFGEGRGARSVVVLALGTGLGAGVIVNDQVVRGAAGYGGEFGHTPVNFDGGPCWCGGRGCLALYASGRGIAESARAALKASEGALRAAARGDASRITPMMVFQAAVAGDPAAAAIIDDARQALGAGIGIIVNGLNPDVLVVTGGVTASLASMEAEIVRAAGAYCFARALASTRIRIVHRDKRVTMRGAAALVYYETRRRTPGRAPA